MAEEKTYVCPNCGAKTTNTENCEHCGSLLVRFAEKGIDVKNTPYKDDSLVLPGLIKELETNLKLQEKYRGKNVDTEISWLGNKGEEKYLFVNNYLDDVENNDDNSDNKIFEKPQLIINFQLFYINEIKDGESALNFNKNQDALLMSFTQLKAYPLFIFNDYERYDDDDFYSKDFFLNCGQDAKGAARLTSELLSKLYGLSSSTNYKIVTSYRDENDDDIDVSTYENNSQNLSDNDSIGNQNNQAKVLDGFDELKKGKEVEIKIDSEKFVASYKDLVIQALTNCNEIKSKAEKGDAESCSQMGMIHLLGINTPIDFKKASQYFGNRSLAYDVDANRMLGFIAECEGNYSLAFKKYANAATGSKAKKPYINKVFSERNDFYAYLKKFGFSGSFLNNEITAVLNDYIKGGDTKLDASIKLAVICKDEESCLDVARLLSDSGDYNSAMRWLKKGNISENNTLYASVKKKISSFKDALNLSTLEVIELEGDSLLTDMATTPSYEGIKAMCDDAAAACKKEWNDMVSPQISAIKEKIKDEEAARLKKQKDAEFEAFKESLIEEEARKKKKRNMFLVAAVIVIIVMLAALGSSSEKGSSENADQKTVSILHNFGDGSRIDHHFVGTFTDSHGTYPIELNFSNEGKTVSNVVYKNVRLGGNIRMHCSKFDNNSMEFEGKDGKKDFIISLSCTDNNRLEGIARVGSKELEVKLDSDCSH